MKKTPRSIPNKRRFPKLIIIAGIIGIAIILLLLKNFEFDNKKTIPIESNPAENTSTTATLPPLQPSTTTPTIPAPPAEETPPQSPETAPQEKSTPCKDTAANLHQLFNHLAQQKYIQVYIQNQPVEAELQRVINKLLNSPPTNSNETADLLSVIRNSSHLFRILGRKDLSFLKEIITNEHSSIEKHFATLYAWSTTDNTCRNNSDIRLELPIDRTYEYAAFFLNTLGGQSYMARRDSTVRTLAKYYCVLILDQAVKHSLNKYNIDLAYHLKSAINDIENNDFLEKTESYLATLKKIENRLQQPRGLNSH